MADQDLQTNRNINSRVELAPIMHRIREARETDRHDAAAPVLVA
jgi:hypothetical protein